MGLDGVFPCGIGLFSQSVGFLCGFVGLLGEPFGHFLEFLRFLLGVLFVGLPQGGGVLGGFFQFLRDLTEWLNQFLGGFGNFAWIGGAGGRLGLAAKLVKFAFGLVELVGGGHINNFMKTV